MPAFLGKRKHHHLSFTDNTNIYSSTAWNEFREYMYKVAKQNMLTPEAHLNSVCTKFKTSSASENSFLSFASWQKLLIWNPPRVNCAAGVRIYLYIYTWCARGARPEFPSGAEIESHLASRRAQSVMQAREEFCSSQELIWKPHRLILPLYSTHWSRII